MQNFALEVHAPIARALTRAPCSPRAAPAAQALERRAHADHAVARRPTAARTVHHDPPRALSLRAHASRACGAIRPRPRRALAARPHTLHARGPRAVETCTPARDGSTPARRTCRRPSTSASAFWRGRTRSRTTWRNTCRERPGCAARDDDARRAGPVDALPQQRPRRRCAAATGRASAPMGGESAKGWRRYTGVAWLPHLWRSQAAHHAVCSRTMLEYECRRLLYLATLREVNRVSWQTKHAASRETQPPLRRSDQVSCSTAAAQPGRAYMDPRSASICGAAIAAACPSTL